ncbi:MAG: type II toxin-antitoxin system RelE/ParE family toxin [Planctomycetes bacterium]|nr:type II toxin-antitoxin system RelE/ParE family toxin [Planctomycetota bacterium]
MEGGRAEEDPGRPRRRGRGPGRRRREGGRGDPPEAEAQARQEARVGSGRGHELSTRAELDLLEIGDRVALESGLSRADAVLDAFERAFAILVRSPYSGHSRPDVSPRASLRFWTVYAHLVAYLPTSRPLVVLRILHGARSPTELRAELDAPPSSGSDERNEA